MGLPDGQPEITTWTSRERFRADYEAALDTLLRGEVVDVRGGEWDGVPVVTEKAVGEVLARLRAIPLPPVDERTAEVRTPTYLTVWAACPSCGIHVDIQVSIVPQLVLETGVGEIKLKAKSKGRIHVCGQLTLIGPDPQQELPLDDQPVAGSEVESVSDDAEPCGEKYGPRLRLRCTLPADHDGDHATAEAG